MVKWTNDYSVGVDTIDEQHKKLFDIANRIYELLNNELCLDKYDKIVTLLDELKDYTIYHFRFEEQYMQSIGYKKYLSHKVKHDDFIDKIDSINYSKIDENQQEYLLDMLNFVVNWISEHILQNDKLVASK